MRRLIVLLLFAVLVAGCGSSGGSTGLAGVTVSGKVGEKPTVTFDKPFSVTKTERKVLTEGDGEVVKVGDKVTVQYVGINGKDGNEFDSSFKRGQPADFTLEEGSLIKGFVTALDGVKVGSRVVVAISPEDGYGPAGGQPSAGIGPTDSLIFVIDVENTRVALKKAQGTPVPPVEGNPTVTLDEQGKPTITMPKGPPPAELVIAPLITGDGAKVGAGQSVSVNVVVAAWSDGRVIESSWDAGSPASLIVGSGQLLPGLDAALTDQPVGSQVLVVVPQPEGIVAPKASADPSASPTDAAPVTKPDALVFVLDILDSSPAA